MRNFAKSIQRNVENARVTSITTVTSVERLVYSLHSVINCCRVRVCTVSSFFSFRPVSGKTKYDILDRFSHSTCTKKNEKRFVFRFSFFSLNTE